MAAEADVVEEDAPKKSKLPLILGFVLALVGGGGGFFAVSSGMLFGASADSEDAEETKEAKEAKAEAEAEKEEALSATFLPLEPLIVSISGNGGARFLRFTAQLEVAPEYAEEVTAVLPRIVDVMNSYLRAVESSDLEDPTILVRLRGQLLRRIQVVVGPDRVRDLLVMEFVLN